MNPDIFKAIHEFLAAWTKPSELETRAQKIGEDFGLQLEKNKAQAGYARAHPESMRAQIEQIANAAALALGMGKNEGPPLRSSAIRTGPKSWVEGGSHFDAMLKAGLDPAKIRPQDEGFVTREGKFVSREKGMAMMAKYMSAPVKAQIATRAEQSGKAPSLTSEDLKGKLYANRGTKAAPPITGRGNDLSPEEQLAAARERQKKIWDSLDSVVTHMHEGRTYRPSDVSPFNGTWLHSLLKGNGGFTVDGSLRQKPVTSGFSVGAGSEPGHVLLKMPMKDLTPTKLQNFLNTHQDFLRGKPLGGWVDDQGVAYIEPITIVKDEATARKLGAQRGEKAIYDLGAKKEIPMKLQAPSGDPDAAPGQPGYISTVDAIKFAKQTIGEDELRKQAESLRHAYAGSDADRMEMAARKVIRYANGGGEFEPQEPKKPARAALDSVITRTGTALDRGMGRAPDDADKFNEAHSDFVSKLREFPRVLQERGNAILDARRNPSVSSPRVWLTKHIPQVDIPRVPGNGKAARVEELASETYQGPWFQKWLEAGRGGGSWYDARATKQKAVDALGEEEGIAAFNDLIDHVAASTAMSRPGNNLRRGSWWRALNLSGQLDPQQLRTHALAAPEGFGHIANKTHHFGVAELVERGALDPRVNPKPASFAENLKGNQRPYTNDTRMATATMHANPEMRVGLTPTGSYTPRKWAYGSMEKAAQQAAAAAQKAGVLDPVPAGVDPTATWQAQVWKGIGEDPVMRAELKLKPSKEGNTFNEIFDRLLLHSAKLWGVSPAKANQLFWQGNPFGLPLDADLLIGPSRRR